MELTRRLLLARQASTAGPEEGTVAELCLGNVAMAVDHLVEERTRRAKRRAEAVGALVADLIALKVIPPGVGVRVSY
jgi:hypothetical protein